MEDYYFNRQNKLLHPKVGRMIETVRILVVGAGALGNEVLKNLVLMGVRHLTIVDFDFIESTNLSRTVLFRKEDIGKNKAMVAAERLREMALCDEDELDIIGLDGNLMIDFGKAMLFLGHDIVICCVDTQRCRAFINDWCVRTRTPLFEGGFEGFSANICFFAPEPHFIQKSDGKEIFSLPSDDGLFPDYAEDFTVCLREEIGQGFFDVKRNSCSEFKAKDTELVKIPTIQCVSAIAGALIATEVIKYLSGKDTLRNKMLYYSGLTQQTYIANYKPDPSCTIHQEHTPIEKLPYDPEETLMGLLGRIGGLYPGATIILQIPEFIISGQCTCCGKPIQIGKLASEMYDEERWCKDCRNSCEEYKTKMVFPNQWLRTPREISVNSDVGILKMRPDEIGIPPYDILKALIVKDDSFSEIYVALMQ